MTSARVASHDDDIDDIGTDGDGNARLLALTDGVVAIAMTLLALDLKPDLAAGASSRDLAHYLGAHSGKYLAFLIAFALIAQYWLVHHRIMRTVSRQATYLFLLFFAAGVPGRIATRRPHPEPRSSAGGRHSGATP